jgi:hypothetical protein
MKQLARLCVVVVTGATCALGASPAALAEGAQVDVPAAVTDALQTALALPEARLDVLAWKTTGTGACTPTAANVDRPINGSGRYAVKLDGAGCGAWGWATLRVFAPAFVTTRPVRAGEMLDDAVKAVDQEVHPGRPPAAVGPGSKAARALTRGQLIEAGHIEVTGPAIGSPVKVLARSGSLAISQSGRVISCGRGRSCAILPTGKHVEGTYEGDVLVVVVP